MSDQMKLSQSGVLAERHIWRVRSQRAPIVLGVKVSGVVVKFDDNGAEPSPTQAAVIPPAVDFLGIVTGPPDSSRLRNLAPARPATAFARSASTKVFEVTTVSMAPTPVVVVRARVWIAS
jgi:hypothetical protein